MGINLSKYVRQGKKTFKFVCMSGGGYGCNILYYYGMFNGNHFKGLRFELKKYTEIESDPDEKDGIGGMTTIRKGKSYVGEFLNDKPHGFCYELNEYGRAINFGVYEDGLLITPSDIKEIDEEYDFSSWQVMPVDPIEEDGFSVLRKGTYFSDGDVRYEVIEGIFKNGKLNGFGTVYYDSFVNGYHTYYKLSGIFKDGELVFGLNGKFENTGGKKVPDSFNYSDNRDISSYGEEIIYEGKKYIGEVVDGVPNGIGCLYESEDKMIKGTFKNGLAHGIGATYKLIEGEWVPYDCVRDLTDKTFYSNSWGIFTNGEFRKSMTWEEFFDEFCDVKKV